MRRTFRLFSAAFIAAALVSGPALAKSRIKDIVEFEGVRDNMLVGYGLVVGLNGTGDSLRNAPFTRQSLEAMLERLGVNTRDTNLNTKNVAAGAPIDATVSAMGDAKSLQGGTLLVTPLLGADGQAYAVSQGTVQTGSISAGGPRARRCPRAFRRPAGSPAGPSSSARSASRWRAWASCA